MTATVLPRVLFGGRLFLRSEQTRADLAAIVNSPQFSPARGMRKVLVVCGEDPRGYEELRDQMVVVDWFGARKKLPDLSRADADKTLILYRGERPRGLTDPWLHLIRYAYGTRADALLLSDCDRQIPLPALERFVADTLRAQNKTKQPMVGVPYRINRYLGGYDVYRCVDEDIENAVLTCCFATRHREKARRFYKGFPIIDKQPGAFVLSRGAIADLHERNVLENQPNRIGDLVLVWDLAAHGVAFYTARVTPHKQKSSTVTDQVADEKMAQLLKWFDCDLDPVVRDLRRQLAKYVIDDWITEEHLDTRLKIHRHIDRRCEKYRAALSAAT
jgi:hypothetical protein